ncbi:hypothetical protein AVEN_263748-1 [Araneus ventricosus]|uniref:Uncharacterized protein n=1 Tax=Araneus ventricosus TaxID=182803 RepID=A0A4Y2AS33_ARAVE|nr:hypothetical protein AVEN_263748-1 [Araneus ventricosus]
MQKRRKCLSTFDYLSRCTPETKAARRNGWLCHNKEKSIYREAKTPRNREKRKQNQRLGTMSRARFVFLLSSIVGLHFICMNFSCLNVARLNNEHLQCRTLSSCLCARELPPLKAAHPHRFLRLPLNISWKPLLPSFVRLRSVSEHERLKTEEGESMLIQLESNSARAT